MLGSCAGWPSPLQEAAEVDAAFQQIGLLAWIIGVTGIYSSMHHALRATRAPLCAGCGRALEGYFARMALKTGSCEHCNAAAFSVSDPSSFEPDEYPVSELGRSTSLR
jgi:hypothetical protein